MANLVETGAYDAGVYQIETADPVSGGAAGIANKPLINLANRTAYLKGILDQIAAGTYNLTGYAKINSQAFTGTPTAPTPASGNNSTTLATTAFVQAAVGGYLSKSVAGGSNVTLTAAEAGNAILNLTGVLTANIAVIVPTSPTACWLVKNATTGAFTLTVKTAAGTGIVVTQGTNCEVWCDGTNVYLQTTDFVSPALTGVPTAPTAAPGTNTTQLATTAFVEAARVILAAADALKAPLASPTLTGVPAAPTATAGTNTTQLATTAFVQQATNGLLTKSVAGGVDVTLTAAEAGASMMKFTGVLTANINVIVPAVASQWLVINGTTGAFTLTVKTAAGTGIAVTQGLNWGVICDGTNVIDALTDFYSTVLSGVPTAPTATAGTNTTQLATTAFVTAADNLKANIASPTFTGVPAAPTAAPGTNTTQLSTTAFVAAGLALKADLASPTFTGVPAAPTAAPGTNTTQVATTAFVEAARVILAAADALKAPLASPTFTGVPAAPTAAPGTNTTQLSTTAFVAAGLALKADLASPTFTGVPAAPTAAPGTNTTQVATTAFVEAARVILAAADALKATIASPTFTGVPAAPTAAPGTNTTQLATTAFVTTADNLKANIASPTFTGVPAAPTAAAGTNTTQLATTAFVKAALGNFAGTLLYSASQTLAAADVGKFVNFACASGGQTLTLPAASTAPAGTAYYIHNTGQAYTLARTGADVLTVSGASLTTLAIGTGGQVLAVSDGTGSWLLSGSGTLAKLGDFVALLTGSGYQKLPSGMIIQWGSTAVASASDVTTNLPIAFPNAFLSVVITQAYTAGSGSIGYAGGNPTNTSSFTWRGSTVGNAFIFFAIGY